MINQKGKMSLAGPHLIRQIKNIIQLMELNDELEVVVKGKILDSFPQISRCLMFTFSFLSCCEHLREEQLPLWLDMEETRSFNQLSSRPALCLLTDKWTRQPSACHTKHCRSQRSHCSSSRMQMAGGLLRRHEGGCTKDARWARLPSAGISWKWGAKNQWVTCALAGMRAVLAVKVHCAAHTTTDQHRISQVWHGI